MSARPLLQLQGQICLHDSTPWVLVCTIAPITVGASQESLQQQRYTSKVHWDKEGGTISPVRDPGTAKRTNVRIASALSAGTCCFSSPSGERDVEG
jgi:hypothetical protein